DSNPNLELYATPAETRKAWFIASIEFINGLVDEDMNVSQDDLQHNSVSAISVLSANSHEGLNETRVGNNDMLLLEGGDGFLDSEGGAKNPESNKDKQPTLADVLDEIRALRKEVALVKFDDARIAKLEILLNDNFMFRNDSPNGNHNVVNQGLSGSANHPMSTCSRPDIDNAEVAGHAIGIHKADGKNDSPNDNGEVGGAGMGIHKVDGKNDIPNINHNVVNQGLGGSDNDPIVYGKNEVTYSQREPSTLDVLTQAFDYAKDHPETDVLQHDNDVDCSVAKLDHHPTTDIHIEPVHVYDFTNDYIDVLNDEETMPNYSLDDMKLEDEEEKLIATPAPVNHQHVDELVDVYEDRTTVLQVNVKYVNVVKDNYKPCLASVFSNVKPKRKNRATTTPAPPKTRSMSVNGDCIAALEFEEDVFGEPKMRLINELMTLEVFVEHLDLWVDLMWYFRDPDAEWAMVSPHFLPRILGGSMIDYFSNGVRYPVAWRDVEKETMVANIEENFATTAYFVSTRAWVLQSKGISVETLSRNLPLIVSDLLQTALAYRKWMLQYFWSHKMEAQKSVLLDEADHARQRTTTKHPPGWRPAEQVANRDPRDIEEIERLQQRIRELELQEDERNEETESNSAVWDDGFDGEENPFCRRPPPQARSQNRGDILRSLGVRVEILEFTGTAQPDEFIDWISTVERVFDLRDIPDNLKVKVVAIKLRKYASLWWDHVKQKRRQQGKSRVETWDKMKKLLRAKFLPINYRQNAFFEYHSLMQNNSSVEQFIADFDRLRMRCGADEDEEQVIARFLGALRPDIADIVQLQQFWTLDDVFRLALKVEKQLESLDESLFDKVETSTDVSSYKDGSSFDCCVNSAKMYKDSEGSIANGSSSKFSLDMENQIKSFLCYMRPLIIIDAAHLKGTYLGTNLVAVGMDGNNQIIPIATGVSQGETGESWTWFLRKLKDCIGEVPNLAIISDKHYAMTLACNIVFPNSFHGYCCCHLMMNCGMKSDKFKELYWKTCKAYTPEDFEKLMSDIHSLRPDAYQKLVDARMEKWSRAKCPANSHNYMTSNNIESTNALTKDVRKIPITSMMDWFRDLLQKWYYERRQKYECNSPDEELTSWATANIKWQLSGLPCGHVCAVARVEGLTSVNYLAKPWFLNKTIKGTYKGLFFHVKDVSTWQIPYEIQQVLPPDMGADIAKIIRKRLKPDKTAGNRLPNGDALRKCILKGPYTPTFVTTPAVPATEDSPAVPEQTTVETVTNMTPENSTAQEMWKPSNWLHQGGSLNIQDVSKLFWEFGQFTFTMEKQLSLTTLILQNDGMNDKKQLTPNQSNHPSESASEEDSDLTKNSEGYRTCRKIWLLIAKYFRNSTTYQTTTFRTSYKPRNKNVDISKVDTVVQQSGISVLNCKEFGHLLRNAETKTVKGDSYEVPNADSSTDAEPLEQVQYDTDDNVFTNDIQHFDQSHPLVQC
ncbi:transposase, MuDR, MULE transposase domain protein, partial [Tanacetum coccineum]